MKDIKKIWDKPVEKVVNIVGWVRSNRNNGKMGFINFNDGTHFKGIQIVYKEGISGFEDAKSAKTGSSLKVRGKIVLTPGGKQPFELLAEKVELIAQSDESFPLQKKRHTPEYLREIAHLRARGNTYSAVMRVRSKLSWIIHSYFQKNDYVFVNSPIITSNDGEGAGESFIVTTRTDGNYEKDFYSTKATLGVTGQLHAEAYAQSFKKVYTFAPTFRAENSNTKKHASEFWMMEPEVAFNDLNANMDLIEDMLKYTFKKYLNECENEIEFFDKWIKPGVRDTVEKLTNDEFGRISYGEAIEILKAAIKEKGEIFENNDIFWGMDLGSEHEKFICSEFNKPVFVYNYPKDIKAFYMKQNDDGKTVAACDLLVPGIGELCGGSEREGDYDKLFTRCTEMGIPTEDLSWYLDLRKFGYEKSAGFGLGFERLIMYVTGMENIRDVIPFPRTSNKLKF